ncbi:MAG: ferredoxin [Verrucomicrobia bacterium Tous-C9LFEB]|nr:MAG: ferredoxin [Verrucomicrobia bacterium Tous-C9LFEB]
MWLRQFRVITAGLYFGLITLLFLDFTGSLHHWLGWLARIQLLPALLALNVGVVVGLLTLTVLFGRIYCSVICPLEVYQDVVSWVHGKQKRNRFSYSPALTWLRYGVLLLGIVAFIGGIGSVVALLDPYGAYGRIASNLMAPVYQWGNNALAYLAGRMDSYAFYSVDVWMKNVATFVVAVLTFGILAVLAWRHGRTYCNTICPVGTVLGLLAKIALFRPVILPEKCSQCGLCARNCKASCIDHKTHTIDYSRCVTCFDCVAKCHQGALVYGGPKLRSQAKPLEKTNRGPDQGDSSRRNFLSIATFFALATAIKAEENKVDGGLAVITGKKIPNRLTPLVPPGSQSASNFTLHCTACQLCVSVCSNQVLRPSSSLTKWMQPEMSFERGYCRPECTKCSEVCPAGAILSITTAEKSAIQIGHAVWIKENCIVNAQDVSCGNCARHCPVGAIQMVTKDASRPDSLKIPVVDLERCIGCGACENLCPVRPFSAIYVEGHERHRVV